MYYSHAQSGTWVWFFTVLVAVIIGVSQQLRGEPSIVWIFLAIPIAIGALFYRLNVSIDNRYLRIAFGIGIVHKKWALEDIVAAEPVRNHWWYGWGIRITPYGWLYNVSGLGAVEVTRRDGGRFRIGTDEPERLAEAIRTATRQKR